MKYAIVLDTDRPDHSFLVTELFDTHLDACRYIRNYCGDRAVKIVTIDTR